MLPRAEMKTTKLEVIKKKLEINERNTELSLELVVNVDKRY